MTTDKFDDLINQLLIFVDNEIKKEEKIDLTCNGSILKYQKEINKLFLKITEKISNDKLNIFGKVGKPIALELLKKYICTYFFIFIGLCQKSTERYISNFIEFVKKQSKHKFISPEFFNSDSTNFIIETLNFLNITKSIKKGLVQNDKISNEKKKEAYDFLTEVKCNTENVDKCLAKGAIILFLYKKEGKLQFAELVDDGEDEYVYIDVIVPKNHDMDIASIMMELPDKIRNIDNAKEFYDLMNEKKNYEEFLTYDEKILRMINSKAIIPIVQDFLLFNKESEKYIFNPANKKNTKIKYIIEKINKAKNYFSEKEKKDSVFIEVLKHRRALAINDYEDLIILTKAGNFIDNQDVSSYYSDLEMYRKYPFINFNEIENNNGFQIYPTKTIDVVRDISINYPGIKEVSKYAEIRTAIEEDVIKVVGFFIPGGILPLRCIQNKNIINVRNDGDITLLDGNKKTDKLLKEINFGQKKSNNGYYWFFDLKNDILNVKKFSIVDFSDKKLVTKLMVSEFYETIKKSVETAIKNEVLKILENNKPVSIEMLNDIINHYEDYFFPISRNSTFYFSLVTIIIKNHKKISITKKKEITTEIKLPILKRKQDKNIIKIDTRKKKLEKIILDNGNEILCQHIYEWNNLSKNKYAKSVEESYENQLYLFISKYIVYNESQGESICKSCGFTVPLINYEEGGHFTSSGSFIFDSSVLHVPLNSLTKYEKFDDQLIDDLDFTFHKIAGIFNLNFYVGDFKSIRARRESKIKDVIDFIEGDNSYILKRKFSERTSKILSDYGINPSKSSLIYFDLSNSIYSSSEDKKKHVMQNVILSYMIVSIIIDIDEEQILEIRSINEKLCTISFFEKFKDKLFKDIKIINNAKKNINFQKQSKMTTNITDYGILCYIIFIFSCLLTKYNVWKSHEDNIKYSFSTQIELINTIVDIFNNIMEVYYDKQLLNRNIFYKRNIEKFSRKLQTIFSDNKIFEKIKNTDLKNESRFTLLKFKKGSTNLIPIEDYKQREYKLAQKIKIITVPTESFFIFNKTDTRFYYLNNITSCKSGTFHDPKTQGKELVCSICGEYIGNLKLDPSLTKFINDKYFESVVKYIGSLIFEKNETHEIILKKINEIQKRTIYEDTIIALKEKENLINRTLLINKIGKILETRYGISISNYKSFEKNVKLFIEGIESILGKVLKINDEYYIRNDIIIVEYTYDGQILNIPIEIIDNEMNTKKYDNHPIFKKPVIQVTVSEKDKLVFFFDKYSREFLGYKKYSEEIVHSELRFKHKVTQSLLNRIINLGIEEQYIDLSEHSDGLLKIVKERKIISTSSSRTRNIKKIIPEIFSQFSRIINSYYKDYKEKDKNEGLTESDIKLLNDKKLYDKYHDRFKQSKVTSKNDSDKFMHNWKKVTEYPITQKKENIKETISNEKKFIDSIDIINNNESGNYVLIYLLENLKKLIEINKGAGQKFVCSFVIDVLSDCYKLYETENIRADFLIERFTEIINNPTYVIDTLNTKVRKVKLLNDDGSVTYTHLNEMKDNYDDDVLNEDLNSDESLKENYDNNELFDAIDMDGTIDYESGF